MAKDNFWQKCFKAKTSKVDLKEGGNFERRLMSDVGHFHLLSLSTNFFVEGH